MLSSNATPRNAAYRTPEEIRRRLILVNDFAFLVRLHTGILKDGEGVARVWGRGRANWTEVLLSIVGCWELCQLLGCPI
jgi:hypothetical protein